MSDQVYSTQVDNVSAKLTSFTNLQPSFVNPNHTFAGWNTQQNGGGTAYLDQASYPFLADVTLYAQWTQNAHIVTFFSNLTSTDANQVVQTSNATAPLTSIGALAFTNPNYTFAGWNTQRNGSGTAYLDQASYPFLADVTLYAQWTQNAHTVTFFSNLTSTDANHAIQTSNATATLTSIGALAFVNPNYTFAGWNTQRNGSGTAYLDQASFTFTADMSLYVQWSANKYSLSFSPNTGTGSIASIGSAFGGIVVLPQSGSVSKNGFQLVGWNTNAQGNGTEYQLGAAINVTGSQTLYAQWSQSSYVVSFVTPGFKVTIAPITDPAGTSIFLHASAGLAKPGLTFAGWYSSAQGGKLLGRAGAVLTPSASLTLYAQWTKNPLVSLEFSDNGGAGHIAARHVQSGLSVAIPGGAAIHRNGFIFRGWASSPRASQPTVHIGAHLVLTRTKILYALWRRQLPATTPQVLLGSVGIFASNSSVLTAKMRQYIASLAISINRHNRTKVVLYGYATTMDSVKGSSLLSLHRALAVKEQLNLDLANLNDVGVTLRAAGEGRLSNSVLASFRNVEIFAN